MRTLVSAIAAAAMVTTAGAAGAQQPAGGPLPPLPPAGPDTSSSSPPTPAAPPTSASPSGPASSPPPGSSAPPVVYGEEPAPPPPPPVVYTEPPPMTHAPAFSLYAGGSLRLLGFGGYFYDNEHGQPETTGNYLKNGLGVEVDVGVRLGHRYIPFLVYEHGFMGQGHRFEGTDASSSSDFFGVGFRYVAGDVNSAGFLSEISVGLRQITVHNGSTGETYKMSAPEIFRLGLGAEIRLSTLFTISPMAHISSGEMTDTAGDITFGADGSKDGVTHPTYRNGDNIVATHGYLLVGIGCGAHFDFFGK